MASTTGVGCNIKINITLWPELNQYSCTNLCAQFLHKTAILIYAVNLPLVASYRTTYLGKGSAVILLLHQQLIDDQTLVRLIQIYTISTRKNLCRSLNSCSETICLWYQMQYIEIVIYK